MVAAHCTLAGVGQEEPFIERIAVSCYNVYILRTHEKKTLMEAVRVGIREFRTKLAQYVLESETPIAITRHGDTVGFFIPAHPKRTAAEKAALKDAAERFDRLLEASGVTEEELVADFTAWRAKKRQRA
jgi:antitoxin (DNA-binding transcriptional repressor) of toxin-antitoxin stability system